MLNRPSTRIVEETPGHFYVYCGGKLVRLCSSLVLARKIAAAL